MCVAIRSVVDLPFGNPRQTASAHRGMYFDNIHYVDRLTSNIESSPDPVHCENHTELPLPSYGTRVYGPDIVGRAHVIHSVKGAITIYTLHKMLQAPWSSRPHEWAAI